ncbi:hydrogenase small subunit [Desulfurispirillum indicum]|uniref:Hydrogenase (NiFe) small subunit HydA n=1 Tax=Desulfurispirillum indicum (strain ATCC BAA-1389 / DSM 22839 / S5) TaxID=653733 RepID=E6W3V1_DESIS|nr:hydrogenase small subunit [Desulfurispirillum indicum]ADU65819.1 hydrogenase (NiFe) small subunit HydA [Desulfurispirillum indicum S5]
MVNAGVSKHTRGEEGQRRKLDAQAEKRLQELRAMPSLKSGPTFSEKLKERGISRRQFMQWAATITAAMSLPVTFTRRVAEAAELLDRIPVIYLHMAECTGCSESLLRTDSPTLESLIFDYLSLEYHETIMAASGWQAEENLERAMDVHQGKYILMVEGAVPAGRDSFYLTIGPHAHTGESIVKKAADGAAAVIAVGACATYGGIQAARPNPTNARPVSKIISKAVINIAGCPPSESNIVGTILHYILFGTLPALDSFGRPRWAYGMRVHDMCERRGRFDAGEFVQRFGDDGARRGYCLYRVGCKGPYTFNNCAIERFNQHTSWPVQAGHGCIGCSEPNFWDTMAPYEEPRKDHLYSGVFGGMGADATADKIGIALLTATAVGIGAHAVYSVVQGNFRNPKVLDHEDETKTSADSK